MTLYKKMHPGEYLKSAFMVPLGLNHQTLSKALNVTPATVSRLVNGKASVSIEMALRLSHALGNSAEQWLNIQTRWDLENVKIDLECVKKLR